MDQTYIHDFDPYHFMLGGALYIFGAFLYMLKLPERLSPGTFDIVVSKNPIYKFFNTGRLTSTISSADCDSCPNPLLWQRE